MELDFDALYETMMKEARGAFAESWDSIKSYAPAEFKKIATQLLEIADNTARYEIDDSQGFSPETGTILLDMQRRATEGVLVAISALTLIAVQNAINNILDALKKTFGGILDSIL